MSTLSDQQASEGAQAHLRANARPRTAEAQAPRRGGRTGSPPATGAYNSGHQKRNPHMAPARVHLRSMGRARGMTRASAGQPGQRRPTRRVTEQATKWTDERLRAELQAFLGDGDAWPSRTDFMSAGKYALWMAVRDHGGHLFWAQQLGKSLRSAQEPRGVPVEELVAQAREVIAARGRLPNQETLRILGYARLATVVKQAGGAKKFRGKHGL